MRHAAVITFPGHFFMTALCIRSIAQYFPDTVEISVVYDDLGPWTWQDLDQDLRIYYQRQVPDLDIKSIPFSAWGHHISRVSAGWWRQQLIKMSIDQHIQHDEWLVVDGDIVFESAVPVADIVPVHCLYDGLDPISRMAERYTDTLLALQGSRVKRHGGRHCITSSIPFRCLDRDLLVSMRQHVATVWHTDFLALHADLLEQQRIVAWDATGESMVLHEWDLIESWRAHVRPQSREIREIGSGYHVFANVVPGHETYRHSSLRDHAVGRAWLEYRGLDIPNDLWHKSQTLPCTI